MQLIRSQEVPGPMTPPATELRIENCVNDTCPWSGKLGRFAVSLNRDNAFTRLEPVKHFSLF